MNIEYWKAALDECLMDEGISATPEQINRIGIRLAEGASVLVEYSGEVERTKPGAKGKTKEEEYIQKLEYTVNRLSDMLDVTVNVNRGEYRYHVNMGTYRASQTRSFYRN